MNKMEFAGLVWLAKTDPGMKDLLDKAIEYWILMGEPHVPWISDERERALWAREWDGKPGPLDEVYGL